MTGPGASTRQDCALWVSEGGSEGGVLLMLSPALHLAWALISTSRRYLGVTRGVTASLPQYPHYLIPAATRFMASEQRCCWSPGCCVTIGAQASATWPSAEHSGMSSRRFTDEATRCLVLPVGVSPSWGG